VAKAVTVVPTSADLLLGNTDETSTAYDWLGRNRASANSKAAD